MKKFFKSKWFIISLCAVVLLASAAVVFALNFNNWFGEKEAVEKKEKPQASTQLFWNINGADYAYKYEGKTSRARDKDDGYYHVLFATQGRQVTRRVSDNDVMNKIDSLDVMGLVFDDKGIVTDAVTVEQMGLGYTARNFYVSAIEGDNVTLNSAEGLDGLEFKMTLSSKAVFFDLTGESGELGIPCRTLRNDDRVVAIEDSKGVVIDVYITSRFVEPNIYYNFDRQWDSKYATTKRKPDADGYYTFVFAYNGKQVELKANSLSTANAIECEAGRCLCFTFDENGIIIKAVAAAKGIGGKVFGSFYDVTALDDTSVTVTRKIQGSSYGKVQSGNFARGCKVYDVTGVSGFKGIETTVQMGDRVHGIKNAKGEICILYVVGRSVESDFYYNFDRKYDTTKKATKRTPDENGYYSFKLGHKGDIIYVKTKEVALASELDSYAGKVVGLKLNGDVIEKVYGPTSMARGGVVASYYDITAIDSDGLITAHKSETSGSSDAGKTVQFKLAKDCEIYVVGGSYIRYAGEPTPALQVGDQIQSYRNVDLEVVVSYVVNRRRMSKVVAKTAYCPDCKQVVNWYNWGGSSITESGHFVLGNSVYDNAQCNISPLGVAIKNDSTAANAINVTVDLNGKTISSKSRVFAVNTYCTFNVVDTVGGGVISSTPDANVSGQGLGIWLKSYAHTHVVGATIDCSKATATSSGSTVYLTTGSDFTLDGGKILCGTSIVKTTTKVDDTTGKSSSSTGVGGGIYIGSKCTFNLNSGEILNGTVINHETFAYGGTFYVAGTLNVNGGKIAGGQCIADDPSQSASGGCIYVTTGGVLNMNDGVIADGRASVGGNIYIASSSSKPGKATIAGGLVSGGISQYTVKTGGTRSGGHGGNIYVGGYLTITGGTIEKGTATTQGGGNISANHADGKFTFTGGTVKDGIFSSVATKADVYLWNNLKSENIIVGGTAKGNIYLVSGKEITLNTPKSGAAITVTTESTGEFATNANAGDEQYFTCTNSGCNIIERSGKLLVAKPQFDKKSYTIDNIGDTLQLDAYIKGAVYTSSDTDIVTIDASTGLATAVAPGTVTITAKSSDFEATCTVTVSSGFNPTVYSIDKIGDTLTLNSHIKDAVYTSSNEKILTIDKTTGLAKAISSGIVTVTAKSNSDKSTCTVLVALGDGVYFVDSTKLLDKKGTGKLEPLIKNITGTQTWSSDDTTVVTVDKDGNLTAADKAGVANVTVTIGKYTATCKVVVGHYHCIECGTYGCETHKNVEFTAWTKTTTMPVAAGHYYLAKDVKAGSQNTIDANATLTVCFNGHTATRTGNAGRIYSTNNGNNVLNFINCENVGGLTAHTGFYNDHSAILLLAKTSTVNIYGGTFTGGYSKYGNVITVSSGCTLNVYGGTLICGTSSTNSATTGGAISVNYGGIFNMYDGIVKDGTTDSGISAGNVFVSGTFNLYGGTISGGRAKSGGNVYVTYDGSKTGKFYMYGGTIENGYADGGHGGNIYAGGKTYIYGGLIKDGTATANGGGNISANHVNSVLELKDVTITGGTYTPDSTKQSVYVWNNVANGKFTVSGKVVADVYLAYINSASKQITVGTLSEGTDIGVAMQTAGVFATGLDSDCSAYFHAISSSKKIVYSSGSLSLASK